MNIIYEYSRFVFLCELLSEISHLKKVEYLFFKFPPFQLKDAFISICMIYIIG